MSSDKEIIVTNPERSTELQGAFVYPELPEHILNEMASNPDYIHDCMQKIRAGILPRLQGMIETVCERVELKGDPVAFNAIVSFLNGDKNRKDAPTNQINIAIMKNLTDEEVISRHVLNRQ